MQLDLAATVSAISLCLTLSASAAPTESDSTEIAFVANAEAGTVALVDIASRSIVGGLDINPSRTEQKGPGATNYAQDTDVSPDGRTIYISRGYLGDVVAFEISTGKWLWQRSLNTGRADHMTITKDGRSLFVSALMDNRVYKLSAATGEILGHVVTGIYPHDNKVSKDGKRLYNSSLGPLGSLPRSASAQPLTEKPGEPFQLTIADVETLVVRDRIKLDKAFRPWHFSPDEKLIYAQLSNEHSVVTYDVASRKVIRRLDLPVKPGVTSADWDFEAPHHGLALTDDGKTLCLAARTSDYAALVNAKDLTLIATIPVGDAPGWAEIAEDGQTCLIANTRSDELSIISIPKRAEVARLKIGDGPKHITVARIPKAVLAALKPSAEQPNMANLPPQLQPFASAIARSKLPHVDVRPILGPTTPWNSKLRGVPYYPKDKPWPVDVDSKPLVMFVQINFAEMPPLPGYPAEGILQLYLSADYAPDKHMWGMRSDSKHKSERDRLTDQSYFRALYFPRISRDARTLITAAPAVAIDDEYSFPAINEARLIFALTSSYVRYEDYRFKRYFGQDGADFFYRDRDTEKVLEAYEKFMGGWEYFARIGGYSRVEQQDPRSEFPDENWVLLFSLDSQGPGGYAVGWGDGGVGNFYIRREDLANRDFSKVMYYWDSG